MSFGKLTAYDCGTVKPSLKTTALVMLWPIKSNETTETNFRLFEPSLKSCFFLLWNQKVYEYH